MLILKLKILPLVALALLLTCVANANEAAKEEEGGAKEEGGKEAGPPVNKESLEYNKKEARLNTLRSRIEEGNKHFNELIEAKKHSKDQKVQQQIAEEMIEVAKERNKNISEFTALKQEVEYQYPNKGKEIDKKLFQQGRKGAEEVEHTSGLDAKLTETKRQMDKKYAPLIPKEDIEAEAANKPTKATPETPKKLRLVK